MGEDYFRLPSSGSYPWAKADYAYAGWVPNVSGHLSFNLLDPQHKNPTYNHQPDLTQPRTVAVHRARLAQDYPFPDFLVKWLRPSAVQDFVLIAESCKVMTPHFKGELLEEADDDNGLLMGLVAILPKDEDRGSEHLRKKLLGEISDEILDAGAAKATGGGDPSRRLAREIVGALEGARNNLACHFVRFALFRTGELRIWYDLNDFLGRDVAGEPANEKELQAAGSIAPQVYYFIKDLLHAHYHHDPHSDQLLPLTPTITKAEAAAALADDISWRYATLRGLTRVVVELRQGRSISGHQQAKGIIAYANAFQTVLARIRRKAAIGEQHCSDSPIIFYDFSNLLMSLDAKDASAQSQISARLQLFAILVGILLSGLALWAGAVQIQPDLCKSLATPEACPVIEPGLITNLVNNVVVNPLPFLVILLTAGVVVFIWWFHGTNALPWVERGIRWLRKLSEAIGAQISRFLKGMDLLGWLSSLCLLGMLIYYSAKFAVYLAPTTAVEPVDQHGQVSRQSPWAAVYQASGKRIDHSGLLVQSVVAPDLRALLRKRYPDFLEAFEPDAVLNRDGPLLFLTSGTAPGTDGGYLLIDPRVQRMEAGLWKNGLPSFHRTPGDMIEKPKRLVDFLGAAGGSDAGPIPLEESICDFERGGTDGRTIQLSGELRAIEVCNYSVDLLAGQSISFDPKTANGLAVFIEDGGQFKRMDSIYTATTPMKPRLRVRWAGWNPKPSDAPKPRSFYVRLSVH